VINDYRIMVHAMNLCYLLLNHYSAD